MRKHVNEVLDEAHEKDKGDIKIKKIRRNVEKRMNLERGALKVYKSSITQMCMSYVEVRHHTFSHTQIHQRERERKTKQKHTIDTQAQEEKKREAEAEKNGTAKKKKKKTPRKKKNDDGPKEPWGPTYYVNQTLCDVIPGAVPGVTEYTRAQVTKELWKYIRKHDLQNADNRRQIDCDAKFKKVMRNLDTVTMFSMNKYFGDHLTATGKVLKRKSVPGEKRKVKKKRKTGDKSKNASNFPLKRLSPELSVVCEGKTELRRNEVVKAVWVYIKANELQNPEDRREILCDANLKKVFGVDKVGMMGMNKHFGRHMSDIPVDEKVKKEE